GDSPDKTHITKGEFLRYFPGEEDLAGRVTNEKLKSGVLETLIWDVEAESKAVLSLSSETAPASIARAIKEAGYDVNEPGDWQDLTYTLQRKGTQSWKVTIKDTSQVEKTIKEALEQYKGEEFRDLDELALRIGMEKDMSDMEEIKQVLTAMKGKVFSIGKNGLRIKKEKD
ncbi:MAG: hypothetical protein KAX49_11700, partial [Halanaerobiales bacterium]|nr:hypothetical protein [Halanaerobiales bacterium]